MELNARYRISDEVGLRTHYPMPGERAIAKQLDRLDAHVREVTAVLKKKEPVGRRLDFLMQELNREANTLSSKAIVTDTTNAAVELKVLIEQMREQVQNLE